jgi:hypothetical protein
MAVVQGLPHAVESVQIESSKSLFMSVFRKIENLSDSVSAARTAMRRRG